MSTKSRQMKILGYICLLPIVLTCNAVTVSAFRVCFLGGGNGFITQANTCNGVRDESGNCVCSGSVGGFLSTGCNTCVSAFNVCLPPSPVTFCTISPVIYPCVVFVFEGDCFCVASPTPSWVGPPTAVVNPC